MREDVRIKLQERQQALRDKYAGIAPRPPLAFAAQIDPLIRKLLDRPGGKR